MQDGDGKLSLQDMVLSCKDLNLGLSDETVTRFHASMANAAGFIELDAWLKALEHPTGLENVLQSRGLAEPQRISQMLNSIAAALEFNQLSVAEGFDAFDADGDGFISYDDLNATAISLDLAIPPADVERLHRHMDASSTGLITLEAFTRLVGAADPQSVLESRGLAPPTTEQQGQASGASGPAPPPSTEVQDALNTVAATVSFNQLSADDGYDAFDVDEDGEVETPPPPPSESESRTFFFFFITLKPGVE